MRRSDVAIVGGGPAGLAVAIEAARRGLSVRLFERQPACPDKACGEGLLPAGRAALDKLGALAHVPAKDQGAFAGIRYLQEDGACVIGRFRSGSGVGLRRTVLSAALARAAVEAGAELVHGTAVRDVSLEADRATFRAGDAECESRVLVAADGLASPLRRMAGLDGPPVLSRRFGLRRHFRGVQTSGFVDVHWSEDVEAYVTPVGEGRCGVALLFDGRRIEKPSFEGLLARFPRLAAQLHGAEAESELRGAGPFRRRVKEVVRGPLVLAGDAAGYVDAITGEGLSLAFEGARALGEALPAAMHDRRALRGYARAHARAFAKYALLAGSLVWLARRPPLRKGFLRALSRAPWAFEGLLQLAG